MKHLKQSRLYRQLKQEQASHTQRRPLFDLLLAWTLTLGLLLLITFFLPQQACRWSCWIAAAGIGSGVLLSLVSWWKQREKNIQTARRLDRDCDAANRLEAAVELNRQEHPLRDEQINDTEQYYATLPVSRWPLLRLLMLAALIILAISTCLLLRYQEQQRRLEELKQQARTASPEAPPNQSASPDSAAKPPEIPDTADLKLTLPEPESRAKPLDEIEWEGLGESTRGFRRIKLSVYVNSKLVKELDPEAPPGTAAGPIKFGGLIVLEDLQVKPFDLVSYHLTGETPTKTLISEPQFIEVRPFREDAWLADGEPPPRADKRLNYLVRFLRLQIKLNKVLFAVRIAAAHDRLNWQEGVEAVRKEQVKLEQEVDELLQSPLSREFPADAINYLEKALVNMRQAVAELKSTQGRSQP